MIEQGLQALRLRSAGACTSASLGRVSSPPPKAVGQRQSRSRADREVVSLFHALCPEDNDRLPP
jgi:hypothetical protein